ncbi:hypothetical protein [Streptomyces flaveus]|uniref:Uncharacterized protein n=1 Tax=Streptomyces flaveus TaxID=66370 RepID=A0A917QJ29_9ACTN|nr:hypothetical protein [Streptomyces flaveus]GGK52679.1 hypothetical protein GCM10010094_11340 [Streptomyces flaveus]
MASDEYVCPVCGHPVEQVVRRHKTLGVFVPLWRPGPCKNPECQAYAAAEVEKAEEAEPQPVVTAESGPAVDRVEDRDS